MASIISGNINLSKINKDKIYEGKKGKYYPVTVVINNEVGEYGDSGYIMTEQTKDERDASIPNEYLGNVKVIWTDGQNVDTTNKNVASPAPATNTFESKSNEPDLPF